MIWALILQAATVPPAPVTAAPIDQQRQQVVDAIRNCPHKVAGEITVCAPDRGVAEGWRIPRLDPRFAGAKLRRSGRGTADGADVGARGTGSCTNVGASGSTGCGLKAAKEWGQWKEERKAEGTPFPW